MRCRDLDFVDVFGDWARLEGQKRQFQFRRSGMGQVFQQPARHDTVWTRGGTDAPICQDTHSGSVCDVSTSAEVCHDALVDLAREETFEAPDDLTFGAAVGRTSHTVVDRWLVVPHADDDRPIEGGVGLAVTAPVEAVPPSGPPGRGGDGTRATELREGGLRANPIGVVAEDNQELGRAVGAHPEPRPEGGRRLGRESREVPVVCGDFLGEGEPGVGPAPAGCTLRRRSSARSKKRSTATWVTSLMVTLTTHYPQYEGKRVQIHLELCRGTFRQGRGLRDCGPARDSRAWPRVRRERHADSRSALTTARSGALSTRPLIDHTSVCPMQDRFEQVPRRRVRMGRLTTGC